MRLHIIDHSFKGQTVNPLQGKLDEALEKFAKFRSEDAREFFKLSGVTGPDARKALAWDRFNEAEKEIFVKAAGLNTYPKAWLHFDQSERDRLWLAITRACSWGERVKAAIT